MSNGTIPIKICIGAKRVPLCTVRNDVPIKIAVSSVSVDGTVEAKVSFQPVADWLRELAIQFDDESADEAGEPDESKPTVCGHDMPSIRELIQAVGDLSAMTPGVEPVGDSSWKILAPHYEDVWDRYFNLRNSDDPLIKLEQAVRAAGFHRAATYERLNGTYRNSNTHPKLADPRTLADQRWESARFNLMVAYVERQGEPSRSR